MNLPVCFALRLLISVNCLSKYIEKTAKCILTNRNFDSASRCYNFHISAKTLTGCQHDTVYNVITYMLCNFHNAFLIAIHYFQCISDCRQVIIFKLNIHNRSGNLYDFSCIHLCLPIYLSISSFCVSVPLHPLLLLLSPV